jgi:hypothetical protein
MLRAALVGILCDCRLSRQAVFLNNGLLKRTWQAGIDHLSRHGLRCPVVDGLRVVRAGVTLE